MPTYYIRLPEDPEKKMLVSNLIGTLEKLNGIEVFDSIGVVLEAGAAEGELMRSLARGVVADRELRSHFMLDHPSVRDTPKEEVPVLERKSKLTTKERKCGRCGTMFIPSGNRQTFCSKECRTGSSGNGSGVKHRKLTGYNAG